DVQRGVENALVADGTTGTAGPFEAQVEDAEGDGAVYTEDRRGDVVQVDVVLVRSVLCLLDEAAADPHAFERSEGGAHAAQVGIQGGRRVDDRDRGIEEREELDAGEGGYEAGVLGGDDVRGEAGLDFGTELERQRSGADRSEGRGELFDLEGDLVAGLGVAVRIDVDLENGLERVERVRAARAVEQRACAEAEAQGCGGIAGGLLDVVAV